MVRHWTSAGQKNKQYLMFAINVLVLTWEQTRQRNSKVNLLTLGQLDRFIAAHNFFT
jgi:hypothetical protein